MQKMEYQKEIILREILDVTTKFIEQDSDEEFVYGLLDLCEKATALPGRIRKRMWVKEWRAEKNNRGSFVFLTKKLLTSDSGGFKNYLRLNQSQFDILRDLVKPEIKRRSSLRRETISAAEKLAVTLRFLATGETFISLNYQTRLSTSFISETIPEMCKILFEKWNTCICQATLRNGKL
ncbi:uncharacterized protein LOC118742325 isoform X2 [Rhagoletis pomonella]|uniref:uncharacterized protein LOC118742325 isoform X2 n=1 Tax=Rhagoletis pomonella TaxID=28610 RepID=UPI0017824302|nr:uncharacterized protein LOC118742325 isoform X2 [Rhagoletis pomonella]